MPSIEVSVAGAGGEASVAGGTAPGGTASMLPAHIAPQAPTSCPAAVAGAGGKALVSQALTDHRERGVFLSAFALWMAMAVLCGVLVVGVAGRASERAQVQSFADAVALAGAAEGQAAASEIADANGAELVSYRQNGNAVEVTVAAFGVRAKAVAERQIRPAE